MRFSVRTGKNGKPVKKSSLKVVRKAKPVLSNFRNLYSDKPRACLICAKGPSSKAIEPLHYNHFVVIGVNDFWRLFFLPDYLVILDRIHPERYYDDTHPQWLKDKNKSMRETPCQAIFSKYLIEAVNAPEVPIELEAIHKGDCYGAMLKGRLFCYSTVTITAIALGIWMGFKQIGISGFDCKHHPTEKHIDGLNESCIKIQDYARKEGIEILNLSKHSMIQPFDKTNIEEFYNLYGNNI